MKKTENVLKELFIYLKNNFELVNEPIDKLKSVAAVWLSNHSEDYDFSKITFEGSHRIVGYNLLIDKGFYEETILYIHNELIYMKGLERVFFSKDNSMSMTNWEIRQINNNICDNDIVRVLTIASEYKAYFKHKDNRELTDEEAVSMAYGKEVADSMIKIIESTIVPKDGATKQLGYIVLQRADKKIVPVNIYYAESEDEAVKCIVEESGVKCVDDLTMVGEYEYDAVMKEGNKKVLNHFKIVKEQ